MRLLHVRDRAARTCAAPYLTPDEVLAIAAQGAEAGCHEALFTLGEAPEERYAEARDVAGRARLRLDGRLPASRCASWCWTETGLLPHANAGAISAATSSRGCGRWRRRRG